MPMLAALIAAVLAFLLAIIAAAVTAPLAAVDGGTWSTLSLASNWSIVLAPIGLVLLGVFVSQGHEV